MKYILRSFFIFVVYFSFSFNVSAITIAPIDVRYMGITELMRSLEMGIITSEQLVNIYLERIEAYNGEFNAVNFINENAVEEAKVLDRERSNGNIRGSLHGIPILVKNNIDVMGIPTTAGAKALADNMPNTDSFVVNKLKQAGAIIIGAANMSEFSLYLRDSNSSYGQVRNAFNPAYSSLGSSGGSATGVALSFAAASIATDTNSTLRVPAAAANLVGFRPTMNLISNDGIIPLDITRDAVGPMTKTVSDSAIIMSVLTGNDYNIKTTDLSGKRIGVAIEPYRGGGNLMVNRPNYSPVTRMMEEKIQQMTDAGAVIVEFNNLITQQYLSIHQETGRQATMCDQFNTYLENTTGTIRSFTQLTSAQGKIYSLWNIANGCGKTDTLNTEANKNRAGEYETYIKNIFETHELDVIIFPTIKYEQIILNSGRDVTSPGAIISSTIGYPSISVPLGFDKDMPYGLEFLALKNREDLLFEITSGFEKLNEPIKITNYAPSLFEISEAVNTLVENYLELAQVINPNSRVNRLLNDTKNLFLNYSNNDNREETAEALNIRYENLDLLFEDTTEGKIIVTKNKLIWVIVGGTILLMILIKINSNLKKKKR